MIRSGTRFLGGGGGIRTHGTFRLSGFQDRRNRPLYHPSVCCDGLSPAAGKAMALILAGFKKNPWGIAERGAYSSAFW